MIWTLISASSRIFYQKDGQWILRKGLLISFSGNLWWFHQELVTELISVFKTLRVWTTGVEEHWLLWENLESNPTADADTCLTLSFLSLPLSTLKQSVEQQGLRESFWLWIYVSVQSLPGYSCGEKGKNPGNTNGITVGRHWQGWMTTPKEWSLTISLVLCYTKHFYHWLKTVIDGMPSRNADNWEQQIAETQGDGIHP